MYLFLIFKLIYCKDIMENFVSCVSLPLSLCTHFCFVLFFKLLEVNKKQKGEKGKRRCSVSPSILHSHSHFNLQSRAEWTNDRKAPSPSAKSVPCKRHLVTALRLPVVL